MSTADKGASKLNQRAPALTGRQDHYVRHGQLLLMTGVVSELWGLAGSVKHAEDFL